MTSSTGGTSAANKLEKICNSPRIDGVLESAFFGRRKGPIRSRRPVTTASLPMPVFCSRAVMRSDTCARWKSPARDAFPMRPL
eukprot:1024818-Pyramimonas_sp.AAC.1